MLAAKRLSILVLMLFSVGAARGMAPRPGQHAWLEQLVGDWDIETESFVEGKPVRASSGKESAIMLGGRWLMADGEMQGGSPRILSRTTYGYDPQIKKFTGTFVSSVDSTLWVYSGTLDATGTTLTMEALGPIQKSPGGKLKFHDRITIIDAHHRSVVSEALAENGQWVVFQRSLYTRASR
jgi:hypothetical protein